MENKDKSKFKKFVRRLKGRSAKRTFEEYRIWGKRYIMWARRNDLDPSEPNVVLDWDNFLCRNSERPWDGGQTEPYSYGSRLVAMSAAKKVQDLGYDVRRSDLIDVGDKIKGTEPEFSPEILGDEQIVELMRESARCSLECETRTKLGFNLILRAADMVRIRLRDLEIEGPRTVKVRPVKNSRIRTHKVIDLPVTPGRPAWECVKKLSERRDKYLFERESGKQRNSLEIRAHMSLDHNQSFHQFARHSAICWFLNNGFGFGDVYTRARHKSPQMTGRYAKYVETEPPEWMTERR